MPYDIILGRDSSDRAKFGKRGLVYIGKGYVTMGQTTSLSNNLYLDVARTHVILIAGKRGCLEGNTLVFTNKGYKKIKEFDENQDKILSFNKETKGFEWENAKLIKYDIENEELIKIELTDGREIILTKEHPLLIATGNNILSLLWLEAENLREGNKLLHFNGSKDEITPIEIINISKIKGINRVYDLTVPKNHSFIANGIISHNSGKSYSIGVLAEELANLDPETSRNTASLIFDTMGIFWTMKFKNDKELALLREWNLETKPLNVRVFVPLGKAKEYSEKSIPFDSTFALNASELDIDDWTTTFNLSITSPEGTLLARTLQALNGRQFTLEDMDEEIFKDTNAEKNTKHALSALVQAARSWGIFAQETQKNSITNLIKAGETTILDLSTYSSTSSFNVRALVIGLVSRKLFVQRMNARKQEEIQSIQHGQDYLSYSLQREIPLIWLFVDEAHEFLPRDSKTPATEALVQILREGRQPGISLVLATQQPGQIHKDVMTQSDIILSHKVTSQQDIEALNQIMQTYLLDTIKKKMNELPNQKGSAIILDDNSERIYNMRVRPRFTWHGGEAPVAVKAETSL